ncbi:MAG: symmetrical bis(5'-nucleosyl)-tetraphosphatase [Gammaproteobacteria bacterium]|nr:symmetrical bis(5'-nucleosyl)-tetraphosphatase [Gammaproteobacteria bacterium]
MDYAIGDVQGCFDTLQQLLKKINFSADNDRLFFLGDVVNRGNKSLQTLRFIKSLKDSAEMVLGNHDFHLLVCALTPHRPNRKDTFQDILQASDKNTLLDYLLTRPLLIECNNALLVHAGIPPQWDRATALKRAKQVERCLQSNDVTKFLSIMYGNEPTKESDFLSKDETCRYSINAMMRMRFCKEDGELEFEHKLNTNQAPNGFKAWFEHENRVLSNIDVLFGHWSTLRNINVDHVYPLDHGCVWGEKLSALNLESHEVTSVHSIETN